MRVEIYQAKDGWRWRAVASNGRIMADSGEAYTRKRDAYRAFYRFEKLFRERT